jgi:hypothetical protein
VVFKFVILLPPEYLFDCFGNSINHENTLNLWTFQEQVRISNRTYIIKQHSVDLGSPPFSSSSNDCYPTSWNTSAQEHDLFANRATFLWLTFAFPTPAYTLQ